MTRHVRFGQDNQESINPETDPTIPTGSDVSVEDVVIEMPVLPEGLPAPVEPAEGEIPVLPAPAPLPPPVPGKKVVVKTVKIKIKTDKWYINENGQTVCIHKDKSGHKRWIVRVKTDSEAHQILKDNWVVDSAHKHQNEAYEASHKVTPAMLASAVQRRIAEEHKKKKKGLFGEQVGNTIVWNN